MEKISLNIYGASGHGKVIIDIALSRKLEINCILDDNPAITGIYDYPVIHEIDPEVLKSGTVVAIGDNGIRKKVAIKFPGKFFPGISHSSAVIDHTVEIGEGTVIMAHSSVNADTVIGKHCILNTACIVEHECVLEDFVHISPGAILAGGVKVGEGSHLGIGSLVIPGIKIGKWSTIGAGAVIIEDVPDYATVVGNPGKVIKVAENKYE